MSTSTKGSMWPLSVSVLNPPEGPSRKNVLISGDTLAFALIKGGLASQSRERLLAAWRGVFQNNKKCSPVLPAALSHSFPK